MYSTNIPNIHSKIKIIMDDVEIMSLMYIVSNSITNLLNFGPLHHKVDLVGKLNDLPSQQGTHHQTFRIGYAVPHMMLLHCQRWSHDSPDVFVDIVL